MYHGPDQTMIWDTRQWINLSSSTREKTNREEKAGELQGLGMPNAIFSDTLMIDWPFAIKVFFITARVKEMNEMLIEKVSFQQTKIFNLIWIAMEWHSAWELKYLLK